MLHKLCCAALCLGQTEKGYEGGFSGIGIFAKRFADFRGIAFHVKHVIPDLEGTTEATAVGLQGGGIRPSHPGTSHGGPFDESAGFSGLQGFDLGKSQGFGRGFCGDVERLTADHAAHP